MTDSVYCPFCCRNIAPKCDEDGDEIEMPEGGRLYVHDDVPHPENMAFDEEERPQ